MTDDAGPRTFSFDEGSWLRGNLERNFKITEGLSPEDFRAQLKSQYTAGSIWERFSSGLRGTSVTRTGGILKAGIWGGLSSVLPITPPTPQIGGVIQNSSKGWLSAVPTSVKYGAKGALAMLGPLIVTYRIGTEGLLKAPRIIAEEAGAGFGAGVGGTIGAAIGSAILPGIGTTAGFFIGAAIGGSLSHKAVSDAADVAEGVAASPIRFAKFLGDLGRRQRRLELGGGISAGNRTQMAATMRQRALMQIHRSGINARSVLGREASYFHSGSSLRGV